MKEITPALVESLQAHRLAVPAHACPDRKEHYFMGLSNVSENLEQVCTDLMSPSIALGKTDGLAGTRLA